MESVSAAHLHNIFGGTASAVIPTATVDVNIHEAGGHILPLRIQLFRLPISFRHLLVFPDTGDLIIFKPQNVVQKNATGGENTTVYNQCFHINLTVNLIADTALRLHRYTGRRAPAPLR